MRNVYVHLRPDKRRRPRACSAADLLIVWLAGFAEALRCVEAATRMPAFGTAATVQKITAPRNPSGALIFRERRTSLWKPEKKPAALLGSYAGWLPRANAGNASKAAKVSPVYAAQPLLSTVFEQRASHLARLALVRAHHSTARGSARGPSPLATSAEAVIHLFARSPISPTALAKFLIAGIPALIASNKPVLQFWR